MGRFLRISNGVARSFDEATAPSIYDQTVTLGATLTTGTAYTIPSSQTYTSEELEVYLNGIRLDSLIDFNYVGGSPPRTQITFTFDLLSGDILRFRIDRNS